MLHPPLVEKALRLAADAHRTQTRKGCDVPYLTHPAAVAMVLLRAGFADDEIVAAALLHDVVEDAGVTLDGLRDAFTPRVAELVDLLTERKRDAAGVPRPWRVRKDEQLARLRTAPLEAKAIALADKLHNLATLAEDLTADPAAWGRFNAPPSEQLWYYRAVLDAAGDDPRLTPLADGCRDLIDRLRELVPTVRIRRSGCA